jgi:hypothetical protein
MPAPQPDEIMTWFVEGAAESMAVRIQAFAASS